MSLITESVEKKDKTTNHNELVRYGLGVQRWTLLFVAFIMGVVSVAAISRVVQIHEMGPSSVIAAPVEKTDK